MPLLPPAPFVVGSPRSGTTMLRLMLDAHPDVAIPHESAFYRSFLGIPFDAPDWLEQALDALTASAVWGVARPPRYRVATSKCGTNAWFVKPRAVLEELCEFVELRWDDAMLRYHERAREPASSPSQGTMPFCLSTRSLFGATAPVVTRPMPRVRDVPLARLDGAEAPAPMRPAKRFARGAKEEEGDR